MILLITGLVLLALGLFSGVVLVAAPLGLATWRAGVVLWVLFPVFTVAGYGLAVIGARSSQFRNLSLVVSGLLVLLALASAAGLVLEAAGVLDTSESTFPLWYVLGVAGVVGVVGAGSAGVRGIEPDARA